MAFAMTYLQDFRQKSKHVRSSMNITGISCYPLMNYQSKTS